MSTRSAATDLLRLSAVAAVLLAAFVVAATEIVGLADWAAATSRTQLPHPVYDFVLLKEHRYAQIRQAGRIVTGEVEGDSFALAPGSVGLAETLAGRSQDGQFFVGFADGDVRAVVVGRGDPTGRLIGRHRGPADLLCVSPDGQLLAAASAGSGETECAAAARGVTVWDLAQESAPVVFKLPQNPSWIGFSAHSKHLVARGVDGSLSVQDARQRDCVKQIRCGAPGRGSAACSPADAVVAWSGLDDRDATKTAIRLYDIADGERRWEASTPQRSDAAAGYSSVLSFSDDGTLLACSTADAVILFETSDGRVVASADAAWHRVTALQFDARGTHVVTAGMDGTIRWWSLPDLHEVSRTEQLQPE